MAGGAAADRFRSQYLALVCGIALALSVFVAHTYTNAGPPRGVRGGSGADPVSVVYSQPVGTQHVVLFVVGSETEAARLESMLAADGYGQAGSVLAEVMVVDTPKREAQLITTKMEQLELGANFQIADLR
jgi:hypothetical protein